MIQKLRRKRGGRGGEFSNGGKRVAITKVSNVIPIESKMAGTRGTVTQSLSETVVIYVFGEATRRVGVETRWAPQELAGNVPRARVDEYRRVATVPFPSNERNLESSPIVGPSILFRSISYIERASCYLRSLVETNG